MWSGLTVTLLLSAAVTPVYKVPLYNNSLLLVAESSQTDGVLLDGKALPLSVVWKKVADSNYSWADVPLGSESEHSVIRHKSARIGVYSYGILPEHGSYGYPAMNFEVYKVPLYNNSLLLVAESSQTDGVLLDGKALPLSVVWKKVADSNYSWADVPLGSESEHSVIRHKSARIGVYSYGILPEHGSYGYPAMNFEDYSELILVREKKTWMGAHKHCQSMQAELVSITSLSMQQKVVDLLGNVTEEGVWIGMRVSLMSGEWYWLSNEPMEYSNWGEGEPSNPFEELCGTIVPKSQQNFPWNNECCYINMPFICHKI
ncbi:UNVERIFIED_CONTAM: hypothetical protein FKN15_018658 [Acipenser sinensis]